jgi:hypothetical protein
MDLLRILSAVLLVVLVAVFWRFRARARTTADIEGGRLDTVAAWSPTATRILTTAEQLAYKTLARALEGYMILAQVPLARFLRVPTRYSYSEWLRRLGNQCADLVVCDMASEVIAVVNVQPPPGEMGERTKKRNKRMARVLKAANIPLHVWTSNALPTVDEARAMLLPRPATDEATARPPAEPTRSRPGPLEPTDDDAARDERDAMLEPPPSTWFDEFNSAPIPLQPKQGRP